MIASLADNVFDCRPALSPALTPADDASFGCVIEMQGFVDYDIGRWWDYVGLLPSTLRVGFIC